MIFVLWNFTIVGIMSIFWKGPKWLQQAYLIVMSAFMAYSLSGLMEWTTWIILGLLVVWGAFFETLSLVKFELTPLFQFIDLIAVLCPWGPLNLLIQHARNQPEMTRPMQALLYSAMVWKESFVSNGEYELLQTPSRVSDLKSMKPRLPHADSAKSLPYKTHPELISTDAETGAETLGSNQSPERPTSPESHFSAALSVTSETPLANAGAPTVGLSESSPPPIYQDIPLQRVASGEVIVEEDEDDERSGLKLGLGDFVFYSLLISRACMYL